MNTGRSVLARVILAGAMMATEVHVAWSQTTQPAATSQPVSATSEKRVKTPNYFIASKAISAKSDNDPPSYVKSVDQFGFPNTQDLKWLLFGAESRTRFELRDDEYRDGMKSGYRFLQRNRIFLGVQEIADPLRGVVEFQDSRQFGGDFLESNREVDQMDILQGYGELYFKDALGAGRPLRLQAGRMTLSYLDNKLVSRQKWNNTTNSFQGFRMVLGQQSSDWQLDVFAVQPVEKRMRRRDRGDEQQWFYGVVGAWRRWSKFITLQPYYFILDQDATTNPDREIHTMGLYVYGPIGETGFDYDVDSAFQWGHDDIAAHVTQRAHAFSSEIGYTFKNKWRPRLSALINYASGDHQANDTINQRFDRLFGTSHMYSMHDLFEWRNMINPALRLTADPTDKIHLEGLYRVHWLANDSDSWTTVGRRDKLHQSGHFVGQTLEAWVGWKPLKQMDIEAGYAYFIPGAFTRETGPADDSDLLFVQTTVRLDR